MAADDLAELRAAARGRDWNALQTALTRLFFQMDFYAALEMAVTRLYDFLPVFERHHPEAAWPRGLLVSVVAYGRAPESLPPEASRPYASPGAANFLAGLFDLLRCLEQRTPLENRLRFAASAAANAILADLAANWYDQHPDAWAEQQARGDDPDPETGGTVRQRIYARFWLDAITAERDTAAWLALADAIERKLSA
jgi:hypothetical protein